MQQQVGLNELLEAGVHFGHQTRRWNPKMRKFIFTERNGIHIIDLRKTLDRLAAAQGAVRNVILKGERILFVCTKPQLRGIVEQEAERCGAFYVTERWLGGMLTNFQTIRKQIRRLKELERGQEENAFEFYTKKERLLLDRERTKLEKYFSGVKDMTRLPGAVFVVDAKRESIAVKEAHRLGVPIIAITDTNADPDLVDFPIPGNDDAIRSVSLIARAISDSVEAATKEVPEEARRRVEELEATTYSTETGEKAAAQDERPRRRPRQRRRPRPEVIAQHKGKAPGDAADEDQGDEAEAEEAAAPKKTPARAPKPVAAAPEKATDSKASKAADAKASKAADATDDEAPAAGKKAPAAAKPKKKAAAAAKAEASDDGEEE